MSKLSTSLVLAKSRATCLENVKNLNVWGSEVADISIIRKMPNLEVASLSLNNITTLKEFSHCPKLKELYLRKNGIVDISEICYLKNLPMLKVLWLSDNPCALDPLYRTTVIRNLTNLNKLDNKEVNGEDRRLSALSGKNLVIPENLPEYTGLDLSNTLKLRDLARHRSGVEKDERPCTPSTDSRTDDEGLFTVPEEQRRHFSSRKSINHESHHLRRDSQLDTTASTASSSVLSAVLLLLKELEPSELKTVIKEAELLVDETDGFKDEELEEEHDL